MFVRSPCLLPLELTQDLNRVFSLPYPGIFSPWCYSPPPHVFPASVVLCHKLERDIFTAGMKWLLWGSELCRAGSCPGYKGTTGQGMAGMWQAEMVTGGCSVKPGLTGEIE